MSLSKTAGRDRGDQDTGSDWLSILVFDEGGAVVHTAGLGAERAIQSLVRDPEWLAGIRPDRFASLMLNGRRLIFLWCPLAKGEMIAIRDAPGKTVFEFVAAVDFAYDIFEHLLSNPFDAMTVVDKDAIVRFISPIHESFFGHDRGEASGKPVVKVIENTRLHKIVHTGKAEIGQIQRMKGANRVVSRTPIFRDGKIVGAIGRVMFSGPKQLDELNHRINSLENEVEFYKREVDAMRRQDNGIDGIIGSSSRIQDLKKDIIRVAPLDVPVLIVGESGVGKELVAQALHRLSSRRNRNMIMVNAAALPATLVESELFGYSAGAFTGAKQKGHVGKFEQANRSTLFLDEIGDMPLDVQAKLLRVLQDGSVEKLGGAKPIKVDFRLISATNRDLESMIEQGEFRLDLFYRISPVVVRVPPLRERTEDIPLLAEKFLHDFAARHGRRTCKLKPAALDLLKGQPWPGNVRQLKHEVERAAIFADGEISLADLQIGQPASVDPGRGAAISHLEHVDEEENQPLKTHLEKVESNMIQGAMTRLDGNKKKVAEVLGISRSYLYKRLSELGIS